MPSIENSTPITFLLEAHYIHFYAFSSKLTFKYLHESAATYVCSSCFEAKWLFFLTISILKLENPLSYSFGLKKVLLSGRASPFSLKWSQIKKTPG